MHWRSSARSGRLVVKQRVADASEGTLVVLDVDASAYGSAAAFGEGFLDDRFEAAVEVVASLCAARSQGVERVQLVTTVRGTTVLTAAASGSPQALLDALAIVQALPPVETAPEELASVVRRTRCSTVLVVSGTPGRALLSSASACSSLASTTVVRVAAADAQPGGRVIDVSGPEDLA